MIGFLKNGFVTRSEIGCKIDRLYEHIGETDASMAALQHQIDQLSAAVIELRKQLQVVTEPREVVLSFDAQKAYDAWRPAKKASKKTTTKPKAKQ